MHKSLVMLFLLAAAGLAPAAEPSARLATFDEVQADLGKAGLRLLDVRPRADYDRGHLPGAVWVDAKAAQALAAKPGALTDRNAWEAWIAPLGIEARGEVLVLDGERQRDAARIWWLLGYLGVEKVGLVDGNVPLWVGQGRPIVSETSRVEPSAFPVSFRASKHATRDDVLRAVEGKTAAIVDARTLAEYTGQQKNSKRGGHVPTACRLEWSDLVDADGRFLPEAALKAKLASLGVAPGKPVITHCQTGGRASVDAFAFERIGIPTKNFYLGWSDWGNAEETPVVEGAEAGSKP